MNKLKKLFRMLWETENQRIQREYDYPEEDLKSIRSTMQLVRKANQRREPCMSKFNKQSTHVKRTWVKAGANSERIPEVE